MCEKLANLVVVFLVFLLLSEPLSAQAPAVADVPAVNQVVAEQVGPSAVELEVARETGLAKTLKSKIEPLIKRHKGEVAVAVRVVEAGDEITAEWRYNDTAVMPTASLIKLPVMIEAYRQASLGQVTLEQKIELKETDKVPGSGILTAHFSEGTQLSLRDAIRLMIRYSDNTATNLVVDQIGLASTGKTMADLGFPETQIHAKVFRRDTSIAPERSKLYGLGSTTAADMLELLSHLDSGTLVSARACEDMIDHLKSCDDEAKFPRFIPSGTPIAHKTGSVTRSRTDAGIIYVGDARLLLCVLTTDNEDARWVDDNAGNRLCADIAKAAHDAVVGSQQVASEKAGPRTMANGAHGDLVEALQRTLNERIQSELSVDGDFGPATEAAVKQFQSAAKLPVTGMVDEATWKSLGTLKTEPDPVPAPDVVNSEVLERAMPLDPFGPPQVSAKAWCILDADSGQTLHSENGSRELPNASTTKLMTALLVLELAQQTPEVLDEIVTFSERADKTTGSTAGVRAGEQLSVRELLYGLLLPSGNDASVALAEHFGERVFGLDPETKSDRGPAVSHELFVNAMNRKAKELKMVHSHFVNPHGLHDEQHYSSAEDLAQLALYCRKFELLSAIASTRQRGCRLASEQGYTRDVVWKNTNRLLGQAGFLGLKTGTTTPAGACLVANGIRDGQELIVVVLGASSSNARYIDARNLFAWAWRSGNKSD